MAMAREWGGGMGQDLSGTLRTCHQKADPAIRSSAPHRFQAIPLRDPSKQPEQIQQQEEGKRTARS